ncbi:class I lanthipeptide [Aquimarina rubra]|uniref:Class I lanthipeptide n=1 Tax=Aquimarina rubra TaxID=1920033 RepID=A0ABW5L8J9_9FLAO
MKKQNSKIVKLSLDKIAIARLNDMHTIKGGNGFLLHRSIKDPSADGHLGCG